MISGVRDQRHGIGPAAIGMRIQSGEDGRTRRSAYRLAGVGLVETKAFFRQLIQARRVHACVAVTAEHVVALRVCHDDNEFPGLFHVSLLYGVRMIRLGA
jgi:hypothetical protein